MNNSYDSGSYIETLKPEKKEDNNPVIPLIQSLFKNEFSGTSWKNYNYISMSNTIFSRLGCLDQKNEYVITLIKKIKKADTCEDILTILSCTFLGECD
jgi:hypothetical protein